MLEGKLWIEKAGVVAAVVASISAAVVLYAKREYHTITNSKKVKVDEWTKSSPGAIEIVQAVLAFKIANLYNSKKEAYSIVAQDSAHIGGLKTTRRAKVGEVAVSTKIETKPPLIIGSMRMGFGHQRIAHGAVSWALDACKRDDRDVYLHDIVNIDSKEANFISEAETLYSH